MCIMRNLSYHVHKEVPGADKYQEAELGPPGSAAGSQRRRRDDASCFGGKKARGGWVILGHSSRLPSQAKDSPCPWPVVMEARGYPVISQGAGQEAGR